MQARYVQRSESIDIVPGKDVAAGEIVFFGDLVGVAKIPIKAGELGSLALSGIFDVLKPVRCSFSPGAMVYWDAVRESAVTLASGNVPLGLAITAARLDADKVRDILNPGGFSQNNNSPGTRNQWQSKPDEE